MLLDAFLHLVLKLPYYLILPATYSYYFLLSPTFRSHLAALLTRGRAHPRTPPQQQAARVCVGKLTSKLSCRADEGANTNTPLVILLIK